MDKKVGLKYQIELSEIRNNDDVTLNITATPQECAVLAKRLGIPEVTSLTATVTLKQGLRHDLFDVDGHVLAHVVQECSVTLDPLQETIDDNFSEMLTTSAKALAPIDEDNVDDQPVELIEGDRIDVTEIVSQWVGLSLNPYPRSDAPIFEHVEVEEGKPAHKPFEILENLKGK